MAILLNDNVQVYAPKALDNRYGPYSTLELAKSSVAEVNRHLGLTVGIGTTLIVEYWWKTGITDTDLVLKTTGEGGGGPTLSVTDAGGDGSLAYDSATGALTYTGPSAAEVRAHLSGGTGVTFSDGQISIGQGVATNANVEFANLTLSQSLTVQGEARVSDGTVTTPSFSFTSEPGSGLYRSGPGNISVGIGGVKKATVSGSGLDVFGELNLPGALFTTTLQAVPPSEDRLISLPDRSGTLLVTDETGAFKLDDLSDVNLSAGLYQNATICWNDSTQSWVVGPDYWSSIGIGFNVLQSGYRIILGEQDTNDLNPLSSTRLKVHGDVATTGDIKLDTSLYWGYRAVDDGPEIPARAGIVLQRVFEYELDYAGGSGSPDDNVTILVLDPAEPEFVLPASVEFTIQVESSDNKLQVIKLSAIRSSDTEWIQTTYGLISNFTDPTTNDVGKLYNFFLETTLTGSVYTGILVAYATDNVSQFESYRITGFYTAIGTNPPAPVLPPAYNFDSTWLNNSSLESIYINGTPA